MGYNGLLLTQPSLNNVCEVVSSSFVDEISASESFWSIIYLFVVFFYIGRVWMFHFLFLVSFFGLPARRRRPSQSAHRSTFYRLLPSFSCDSIRVRFNGGTLVYLVFFFTQFLVLLFFFNADFTDVYRVSLLRDRSIVIDCYLVFTEFFFRLVPSFT